MWCFFFFLKVWRFLSVLQTLHPFREFQDYNCNSILEVIIIIILIQLIFWHYFHVDFVPIICKLFSIFAFCLFVDLFWFFWVALVPFTQRANDSKPKEDLNCEVCTTARSGHRNAHILQDGYSYLARTSPTKSKDAQETASRLRKIPASFPKATKSLHRHVDEVYQRSCQDQQRTHDTITPHRSETVNKEWWDSAMMLLLLAEHPRQTGPRQDSTRVNIWCAIWRTSDPARSPSQAQGPAFPKMSVSLVTRCWMKYSWAVSYVRARGMGTWLGYRGLRRRANSLPKSSSKESHTKQTHMKKLFHFHVRTELSKCSIAFALTVAKHPLGETVLQDEERRGKRRKNHSKRKTETTSGACVETSSHEVHRSTLFVPKEETFLSQTRYVDLMRQTRTSNDNALKQTLNDCWNAEWGGCTLWEWISRRSPQLEQNSKKHRGFMNAVCSHGTMLGETWSFFDQQPNPNSQRLLMKLLLLVKMKLSLVHDKHNSRKVCWWSSASCRVGGGSARNQSTGLWSGVGPAPGRRWGDAFWCLFCFESSVETIRLSLLWRHLFQHHLSFSHRRSCTGDAFFLEWSHVAFVSKHKKKKQQLGTRRTIEKTYGPHRRTRTCVWVP